ncbi:MAG: hypothetical protein J0M26_18175 [Planctomycetes bacterium]|nr:hypothetical protein [Planctomycetota bacterium]
MVAVRRRGFHDKMLDVRVGVVWIPNACWVLKDNNENYNGNENAGCHADDDRSWDLACRANGLLREQPIIQSP